MWKGAKLRLKYKVIYKNQGKYPIIVMCNFFKVSRSGYYAYVHCLGKPEHDATLARQIADCQTESRMTYGYRRVWLWLARQGIHYNPKTVLRVMNKYGLLSQVRRRKKYYHKGEHMHKYENLLNLNFVEGVPNAKWVTDISYIHTAQALLSILAIGQ